MPLNLTQEEKDSLQRDDFVLGNTVIKLLQHYNPEQNITQVHDLVSTPATLNIRLNEILNDKAPNKKHLLVLSVNVLSKEFDEHRNNHFVGLM